MSCSPTLYGIFSASKTEINFIFSRKSLIKREVKIFYKAVGHTEISPRDFLQTLSSTTIKPFSVALEKKPYILLLYKSC